MLGLNPLLEMKSFDIIEVDPELLPHLSSQCLLEVLAWLNASAWQSPLARKHTPVDGLPADENATAGVRDDRHDDETVSCSLALHLIQVCTPGDPYGTEVTPPNGLRLTRGNVTV